MSTEIMESEIMESGRPLTNGAVSKGYRPFQLAEADVAGRPTVLLVLGSDAYRLNDLLGAGISPPEQLFELFADWPTWQPLVMTAAVNAPGRAAMVQPERWLLPVRPAKLICIGTNYHGHLQEMGTPPPVLPYAFLKPVSTGLVPSGMQVRLPIGPKMVDWEAELAIVIGSTLHGVRGPVVLDAVAGYTILNDLSARDWISSSSAVGIDWVLMKGYDGFSPIGPFITPSEFVPDPQALGIRCWVNGELKQDSNTSDMVFSVQQILEHLAGIMTLEPGDVIATGTPAGVGYGRRPQQFLHHGDMVAVEIDGLGRLETPIIDTEGVTP
jgi:2-keto-4-pentenoate hydratase/2-oxohepta-3-ene-1,7-dioic acid hydratase in catechol pathway